MPQFAEINAGTVIRVIVADQEFIDSGKVGPPANWIETSYTTKQGKNDNPSESLRGNFAGIGYSFDAAADAFIPPQPYDDWLLDNTKSDYIPPVPAPEKNPEDYTYDQDKKEWISINTAIDTMVSATIDAGTKP